MDPSPLLSFFHMYVGNDLVDMTRLSPRARRLDKAYLNKVCTSLEQQEICSAQDPVRRLAMYWGIKEAAYKVYVQQTGHRFFRPKVFEVHDFFTEEKGYVSTPQGLLFFQIQQIPSYLHIICLPPLDSPIPWSSQIVPFTEISKQNQSYTLKEEARGHLAEELGLPKSALSIRSNKYQVPEVYEGKRKLPVSISFSHDGNWGAYAFSIPHCFLSSSSKFEKADMS